MVTVRKETQTAIKKLIRAGARERARKVKRRQRLRAAPQARLRTTTARITVSPRGARARRVTRTLGIGLRPGRGFARGTRTVATRIIRRRVIARQRSIIKRRR